jgi:hypothetical protein
MCGLALALVTLAFIGCRSIEPAGPSADGFRTPVTVQGGALPRPQAWADCELFNSIVTPATFKPESDPFDELYAGGNGFKNGVPLISESKPGDQDYNGGRWHLNVLKDGVSPDKYANRMRD